MVVCSLARVKIVHLRVQLRRAQFNPLAQLPFPFSFSFSLFFSLLPSPGSLASFSRPLESAAACMCSTLHSLSAAPALESPRLVLPFFYSSPCSPTLQTKASESCFSRRILPESEVGAVHPFSKIRELWFVPVSQALVLLSCSKYLLSFPDFCCMSFQTLRSVS